MDFAFAFDFAFALVHGGTSKSSKTINMSEDIYGGINGSMLYPIVHFFAACFTKWVFMGKVKTDRLYGHRSWMHARWVLSYQFLNKSIRVNSEFYAGTGWYSIAARLLGSKVGRNANFKWARGRRLRVRRLLLHGQHGRRLRP